MEEKFLNAFAQVIRLQIALKEEVVLDGVGVFRAEHQEQYQQQYRDGRVVMMPPKDTIRFVPDSK